MAKLTKTQEWLIVVAVGVVLLAGIGVTYWFVTKDSSEVNVPSITITEKTEEEKDLSDLEKDLSDLDSLDTSQLDSIEDDLDSIDLTELN